MANTTWSSTDRLACTIGGTNNLTVTNATAASGVRTINAAPGSLSRQYYWEYTCTNWAIGNGVGVANTSAILSGVASSPINASFCQGSNGNLWINGANSGSTLGTRANGDVIGIALDFVNNLIWFRVAPAGNWNGSGTANPATAAGGISISAIVSTGLFGLVCSTGVLSTESITANFGDTAFTGAVPAGFTSGLPAPVSALTQIWTGGVARESLVSSPGDVRLGGVAREALISGLGTEGRARANSYLQATLTVTGGVTTIAGGAGGGGAGGLYGIGETGGGGKFDGTGGYGGAGDNNLTPRQNTPSTTGNAGTEWNGLVGSGSGGSGGSWGGSGHGGSGGVGGTYGGGGGGGGGGLSGGGLGALGGEGVIWLQYNPGSGPINIVLTKDSGSSFTFPSDWTISSNTVLMVGAGGCGGNGGLTTGGNGGGGGSVVRAINTDLYYAGEVIPIHIPTAAQVCAGIGGNTVLGSNSAAPGVNGDGTTGGTPSVPIDPSHGGTPPIGGGGGGPGGGGAGGGVEDPTRPRQWAVTVVS